MTDWAERDLEDCIEAYAEDVFGQGAVVYGRQVKCRAGIIDLIIGLHTELYIVELKAKKATIKDVGQVCRYAEIVRQYSYHSRPDIMTAIEGPYGVIGDLADMMQIEPVLVAPSFDDNVLAMCTCYSAELTEDGFCIEYARGRTKHLSLYDAELPPIIDRFAKTLLWGNALASAPKEFRRDLVERGMRLRWPATS